MSDGSNDQLQRPASFQFLPFFQENLKFYSGLIAFFAFAILNRPETIFVFFRLLALAIAVLSIIYLMIQAIRYQARLSPNDLASRREIYLFCIFQIVGIACLVYNEIKPDSQGITTLPSFLLLIGWVGFLYLLTSQEISDRNNLVASFFISFVLSSEIWLYLFFTIQFFEKIAINPTFYFWLVIGIFSISFAFLGGIFAYISMFSVHYPTATSINFFHFLLEENVSRNDLILQILFGMTTLFTIFLIPIFYPIFVHP